VTDVGFRVYRAVSPCLLLGFERAPASWLFEDWPSGPALLPKLAREPMG
jgi:hypothetical protein